MNIFDTAPADPTETMENMSLDDLIDYAEWQVSVAQSHLDDLKRQKAELDTHIEAQYQNHLDTEFGRVACESDAADRKVAEVLNVSN